MEGRIDQGTVRRVKVRVNVSGSRYVGYVSIVPPKTRISDVLNEDEGFMVLLEVDSIDPIEKGAQLIINKNRILYVNALEEFPRNYKGIHSGEFVPAKIRVKDYRLKGEIFLPTHLINQERAALLSLTPFFLNVKNVTLSGTNESYAFMAVSKNQINTLEIKD